jgi:threonine aldolase
MQDDDAIIDLRSDTVTKPCAGMLAAMADARVGDDQYGEDIATNELQDFVADLLGKARALWLPSGTMANQVALRVATRPGDDVIVSREAHSVWHELGGSAANAGVHMTEIGHDGHFDLAQFEAAIKPQNHHIYPPTTMVQIEQTHNRASGAVFSPEMAMQICGMAKAARIFSYMDGARLWNAAVATGIDIKELAAPFDAVMVSLSKGLGAPGGSILAGSARFIEQAVRQRRIFGGAMRQTGYYAAAGQYALTHNLTRLNDDHTHARTLAQGLATCEHIEIDVQKVQTNIIVFNLKSGTISAPELVRVAKEKGVLMNALGPRKLRLVTHLDVSAEACIKAAELIADILTHQPHPCAA